MHQYWRSFSSSLGSSTSVQSSELHSSLQKYFTQLWQHELVAKHLYSSKTSQFSRLCYVHFKVSATWLLQCIFLMVTYPRRWVFCGRHDSNLHRHQEYHPTVNTDPGTAAAPLSPPACSIPQRCAGTGRAAGYLHSLKPSLKR